MNIGEILKHIDHTELKPTASWENIKQLCDEALEYKTASVCIPPCYVKPVNKAYRGQLNICTVIGFPLGYSTTESKLCETRQAILDGAKEIDMVININDIKNGDFDKVQSEIIMVKKECRDLILKVIVETCYLTQDEKIRLCRIVTDSGADYIKTSTGFGDKGAVLEDIELFKTHIGAAVKIKAAGGIRTKEQMKDFLKAGCDRIGSSAAASLFALV